MVYKMNYVKNQLNPYFPNCDHVMFVIIDG